MIELKVEDYCQNCPDFEPEAHRDYGGDIGHFVICCEHRNKCASLKRYIERNTPTDAPKEDLDTSISPKAVQCHTCPYYKAANKEAKNEQT